VSSQARNDTQAGPEEVELSDRINTDGVLDERGLSSLFSLYKYRSNIPDGNAMKNIR
jgi:hypothetical protein